MVTVQLELPDSVAHDFADLPASEQAGVVRDVQRVMQQVIRRRHFMACSPFWAGLCMAEEDACSPIRCVRDR